MVGLTTKKSWNSGVVLGQKRWCSCWTVGHLTTLFHPTLFLGVGCNMKTHLLLLRKLVMATRYTAKGNVRDFSWICRVFGFNNNLLFLIWVELTLFWLGLERLASLGEVKAKFGQLRLTISKGDIEYNRRSHFVQITNFIQKGFAKKGGMKVLVTCSNGEKRWRSITFKIFLQNYSTSWSWMMQFSMTQWDYLLAAAMPFTYNKELLSLTSDPINILINRKMRLRH